MKNVQTVTPEFYDRFLFLYSLLVDTLVDTHSQRTCPTLETSWHALLSNCITLSLLFPFKRVQRVTPCTVHTRWDWELRRMQAICLQWGKASARIGGVGHMNMQESVKKKAQKKHGKELYSVAVGGVSGKSTWVYILRTIGRWNSKILSTLTKDQTPAF